MPQYPPVEPSDLGRLDVGDGQQLSAETVGGPDGRPRTPPEHLLADLEALREHLGIERWVVAGGSWGSTPALFRRAAGALTDATGTDAVLAYGPDARLHLVDGGGRHRRRRYRNHPGRWPGRVRRPAPMSARGRPGDVERSAP